MTSSPSETSELQEVDDTPDPLAEYAAAATETVGGVSNSTDHGTIKIKVAPEAWVAAATAARDELGLVFFSWLSGIDWANDVEVGDAPEEPVEERYEVIAALSDLSEGRIVLLSTDLPKDEPTLDSLISVYAGANWHEREAAEMFGITFAGHPDLTHLYLPDSFEGHPLRKSYPLLSREVKPWPGKVDVEDMPAKDEADEAAADPGAPSTENPEA